MRTLALFRSMPYSVQFLLINQCGIAIGFYLLVPYLAVYLRDEVHLAAGTVGAVLGAHIFAQHGLTVLGGSAVDRFGCRPVIITGSVLRVAAFATFAMSNGLAALTAAAVLTGLAGALFTAAIRAYLALEAPEQRVGAFALLGLTGPIGAFAGPLLGVIGFRATAWLSAALFAALAAAQLRWLPAQTSPPSGQQVRAGWRQVLGDRRFLAFTLACAAMLALYNQLFLLLPLEATRVTGWVGATSAVLLLSTLLTLLLQVRLAEALHRRVTVHAAITLGLLLAATAFVVGAVSVTWVPGGTGGTVLPLLLAAALPIALTTGLLTVGLNIAQPFGLERAAAFASPGLTGTYLGVYATVSGLVAALGNIVVGYLADLGARWDAPMLPWLTLTLVAGASAAAILATRQPADPLTAQGPTAVSHIPANPVGRTRSGSRR